VTWFELGLYALGIGVSASLGYHLGQRRVRRRLDRVASDIFRDGYVAALVLDDPAGILGQLPPHERAQMREYLDRKYDFEEGAVAGPYDDPTQPPTDD